MRKLLLLFGIFLISCAPLANFETYDIYSHYPFIYDEDIMIKDQFPPKTLEIGEGFVMYMGLSERTIYRKNVTIINIGDQIFPIHCKVKVWNGTKIYVEVINKAGELNYTRYIIIEGKKYMMNIDEKI